MHTKHAVLMRTGAALLAIVLVATSCGGSSTSGADVSAAAGEDGPTTGLAFLGDLAQERAPATVQTFDGDGGELTLDDGTVIRADAGAFGEATEVTAQAFDLDLAASMDQAPWTQAYVVSTVDDVDLGEPVIIEIQRPAAGLRAVQRIDGEVQVVPVNGDETARIEIPHFSEVVTMVIEAFNEEQNPASEPEQGGADASFFTACFAAVNGLLGGSTTPRVIDATDLDRDYADQMSMSICTNALIRRASPSGRYVSTECVGDRVSADVDFREAVAACDADENGQTTADQVDADEADTGDTGDEVNEDDQDAAAPPTPLIDGVYTGENGYIWVYSDFEVINDLVRVEVVDGAVVSFEFDRDWFKYINLSSASPDWFEGAVCDYDANVRWTNDGPAVPETVVDEATGAAAIAYRQPGQLNFAIDFPTCPREYVPVSRQEDGTDNVDPIVGWALIRQAGPDLTVVLQKDSGDFTVEVVVTRS